MKSEFHKKIRLGDSVDKRNCSKPAHYVKTRGPQKRRNERLTAQGSLVDGKAPSWS